MADTTDVELADIGDDKKRVPGKKIVLIVLPLLLLLGGGAGAYFMGFIGGSEEEVVVDEAEAVVADEAPGDDIIYFEVPDLLVNLSSGDGRHGFLKLKLQLEVEDANTVERIETVMPRIIDNFQVYLRELRVEDLQGAQGMYRLKEELLVRVNAAVRPAKVHDVLITEMLVQ